MGKALLETGADGFRTKGSVYIPRFGGAFEFALQYYSLTAAFSLPVALGMVFRKTPWWSDMAAGSLAVYGVIGIASLVLEGVLIACTLLPATERNPFATHRSTSRTTDFSPNVGLT